MIYKPPRYMQHTTPLKIAFSQTGEPPEKLRGVLENVLRVRTCVAEKLGGCIC